MPHPILSVEDVAKTYDGFKAISALNFYLYEGELRTVIGPNGAGKSTNPKLLILDEPTEGIQPSVIEHIGDTLKKLKIEGLGHDYTGEVQHAIKVLKAEGKLAILLVEQFVDFCRDVADRFYALDRGTVVISGPIASLTDEVVKKHLQV